MGRIIFSQKFSSLSEALAEDLANKGKKPLELRLILVPDNLMKSWLLLELARKTGGILGLKVLTAHEWIASLAKTIPSYAKLFLTIYKELGRIDLAEHLTDLFFRYGDFARELFSQKGDWQTDLLQKVFTQESFRLPIQMELSYPGEIFCFGVDFLPPTYWKVLASSQDLSLYLFSPCVHFWEDIATDWERRKGTLLENTYAKEVPPPLANWGKLGRKTLQMLDSLGLETEERYLFEAPSSLLQTIQDRILQFELHEEEGIFDDSIRFFRTGSSRLREVEVLADEILKLARKGVPFSEMRVLGPDMASYTPLIELVFLQNSIPYAISGVETSLKSPFLQAVKTLVSLISEEWTLDALSLLFQKDLDIVREWIPIYLREGASGLLNASFFLGPEKTSPEINSLTHLDSFLEKLALLEAHRVAEEKTLGAWVLSLEMLISTLLEESAEEDFLKELRSAAPFFGETTFPFEALKPLLFTPTFGTIHGHHLHAVKIAPFKEGAVTEETALFLIGMDEESFPRLKLPSSLDLLRKGKLYIPDSPDLDRYLFLRALFSANNYLRISWGHISKEEGRPLGPSSLVEELKAFIGVKLSEKLTVTTAPLQAKKANLPIPSFTLDGPPSPLPEGEFVVSIQDLSSFAKHPWRHFFRKKEGIYLEDREEASFALQKAKLLKETLHVPLEKAVQKHTYELPEGLIRKAILGETEESAADWKETLDAWGLFGKISSFYLLESNRTSEKEFPAIRLSLTETLSVKIVGELKNMTPEGLLSFGKDDLPSLLRVWPEWLISAHLLGKGSLFCLKSGKIRTVQEPLAALKKYLLYYFSAKESPSPLLPDLADSFLKQGNLEKKLGDLFSGKILTYEDPLLSWIESHVGIPSPLKIEEHWKDLIQKTFLGAIDATV